MGLRKNTKKHNGIGSLTADFIILAASVVAAILLVQTQAIPAVLDSVKSLHLIGSFVAGLFFTSIFTTVPAIVALGEISNASGALIQTAFVGSIGAVIGDLIMFNFVRDRLSQHLVEVFKHRSPVRRLLMVFRVRHMRWLTFLVGGLVIASPLPDELGIGILGFARLTTARFIAISFLFNFIGIVIIGLVAGFGG